jgi:CubicO group peptidase (beta-lactamase class C family)
MVAVKSLLVMFLSLSAAVQSAKLNDAQLRSTIKRAMERCGVPGMGIAVLHKNELIFADGFGKRNKDDPYTAQVCQTQGSCLE